MRAVGIAGFLHAGKVDAQGRKSDYRVLFGTAWAVLWACITIDDGGPAANDVNGALTVSRGTEEGE